jgi:type IV pilus assembly protein PilB
MTFYKGMGCTGCNQTGYKGRIAVHEILTITHDLRELIHGGASVGELYNRSIESGMKPLRMSAIDLLNQGITTLEEVINISHGL